MNFFSHIHFFAIFRTCTHCARTLQLYHHQQHHLHIPGQHKMHFIHVVSCHRAPFNSFSHIHFFALFRTCTRCTWTLQPRFSIRVSALAAMAASSLSTVRIPLPISTFTHLFVTQAPRALVIEKLLLHGPTTQPLPRVVHSITNLRSSARDGKGAVRHSCPFYN